MSALGLLGSLRGRGDGSLLSHDGGQRDEQGMGAEGVVEGEGKGRWEDVEKARVAQRGKDALGLRTANRYYDATTPGTTNDNDAIWIGARLDLASARIDFRRDQPV